jgi:hypothetical protein
MAHRRFPLLLIGGAAGAGKSTVREALIGSIDEIVTFDSDVLWRGEYENAPDDFRRLWLRLANETMQSGRPVAVFGAGLALPQHIEPLPERASFDGVHYLALVADDKVLAMRIRSRKAPRCTTDAHVEEHVS